MHTVKFILLALLFSCLLAACGLRGPLYLPDEATTPEEGTPQATEAQNQQQEQEDSDKQAGSDKEDSSGS